MSDVENLVVPELGESITEAVVSKWCVGIGEHVDIDQPVVDLETDKITMQIFAPVAGALKEQRFSEGDTVKVGDVIGMISAGEAAAASPTAEVSPPAAASVPSPPAVATPAAAPAKPPPATAEGTARHLTPAQRRARRNGESAAAPAAPAAAPATPPATRVPAAVRAPTPATPSDAGRPEDVVPMSPLRRRIADRLVQAQQSSASLTTFNEVDMSAVMALRSRHKDAFFEAHGVKLGFMSFFAKAAVAALEQFPGLNAEVRDDSIVYKKYYDLGVAVGTERGLVVPVLRACDRLSFAEIEQGIIDLATKARTGKLVLSDLMGGTFTLTNGGIYGSMMSTPLLNFPQTGILGMHNITQRPMAVGDRIELRPMMYVALTYDHRVVDGKEAVQFLVALKQRIEQPDRLMFGL